MLSEISSLRGSMEDVNASLRHQTAEVERLSALNTELGQDVKIHQLSNRLLVADRDKVVAALTAEMAELRGIHAQQLEIVASAHAAAVTGYDADNARLLGALQSSREQVDGLTAELSHNVALVSFFRGQMEDLLEKHGALSRFVDMLAQNASTVLAQSAFQASLEGMPQRQVRIVEEHREDAIGSTAELTAVAPRHDGVEGASTADGLQPASEGAAS